MSVFALKVDWMGDLVVSPNINFQILLAFQDNFQKDLVELIEIYLSDAPKKFLTLNKTLASKDFRSFSSAIRDLRCRSLDIGAVQFSHACLGLELAMQEMRLECIPHFLHQLQSQFLHVEKELQQIKQKHQQASLSSFLRPSTVS